jgi:hypothetical protein
MKIARLSLALAAASVLLAAPARADVAEEPSGPGHSVGLYVSNIAGSGLTYAQRLGGGYGFHVSAIGWGQAGSLFANAGGALTREIDRRPWGTLYGLLAAGVGLGTFSGGGGLPASAAPQYDVAPGLGFTWGPLVAEIGYSIYYNDRGIGFTPAGGAGLLWWF